ncbi:helix-turn-helix domain-containing protein [Corynebacterium sp. TAE3-ERU16]|uniref:helix-turn-helix domain-containing protein n=1 Tax=Corynebacterium sp. TAE3-ERU16 TaxID=2849493 RepID=UPI001C482196|nr:helix-turn-helix domain-containing protein [Corynebacterium sp. TAE3-ERU16]MBV7292329.1 helix-turn-helix domain-containing protein [Corynebacterium sp. TAE3-ERU16]
MARAATLAPPPIAYSAAEAAKALGISRNYVYQLLRAGEIQSKRSGKRIIITVDALREYVERLPDYVDTVELAS